MATIDDLRKSITEMSDDELFKLHRDIRQSRRTPKKTTKGPTRKPKKTVDVIGMAKSMTEEARRELIRELENS